MPSPHLLVRGLLLAACTSTLSAQHEGVVPDAEKGAPVDYLRDVRPILTQHCYPCHGPDENERKGDLRLDRKPDAMEVLVAGKVDESELILRIVSEDPDEVMPPPECDDKLKPAQIAMLRRWVASGAEWSEHWAFVAPVRPTPPPVQDNEWSRNEIDAFVLARLEQQGLRPSGEAGREVWLRRVTFDLIGLPPTPKEIDTFLRDSSADAYAKVVDRLLADERYGERMASDWLDVARYADSSGYQRDSRREAWKWRDWVIDALNKDMPFDQFTVEQLAGDLLEKPTLAQRIATGFNRNHPVNTEAGEELDEYRSAYVIDRVHATSTAFMGLSMACAQCHDHKYDPITQKEYYSFFGFFNSVKEKDNGFGRNPKPAIAAPGEDDLPKLRDLERRIDTLKKRLEQDDPLADESQREWEQATRERLGAPIEWQTLRPSEFMARYGSRLKLLEDGSVLATGPTPSRDTYDLVFEPGTRKIQALRIEVLPDESLPHQASGRADDGRFILSRLSSRLTNVSESSDPPLIAYAVTEADINQERDRDEHYLTAINPGSFASAVAFGSGSSSRFSFGGWSIAGEERKQLRHAVLVPLEPLESNEKSILRFTLEHTSRNKFRSLIGRFRFSFTEDERIREQLVPLAKSEWRSIGPFPAESVEKAYAAEFGPESDLKKPSWKKKHVQPIVAAPAKSTKKPDGGKSKSSQAGKPESVPMAKGAEAKAKPQDADGKPMPKSQAKPAAKGEVVKSEGKQPSPGAKPANGKPAEGKSESTAKAEVAKASKSKSKDKAKPKRKPKPKRLAWDRKRDWRDGRSSSISVQGAASATYVSRKLETEKSRTARIEFRGGDAAKVWLNGKVVGTFEPEFTPPKKPAPSSSQSPGEGFNFADFGDAEGFDFESFRRRRSGGKARELRIGLRKGTNHLVIKLVGKGSSQSSSRRSSGSSSMSRRSRGSSISFSCEILPEGEDVLDYETLVAVRHRAHEAESSLVKAAANATADKAAANKDEQEDKKAKKGKQLTPPERRAKVVRKWFRSNIDVAGRVLAGELRKLEREKSAFESKLPSALVMEELEEPRPTHVYVRGDYRRKGELVDVDTPSVLPPMPKDLPKNRLGLARWLVAKDNPLTARVTVNRAWQQFFGRGLVSTPEDFGIRGAQPSHPKLLDWLAREFVDGGWKLKKLHRSIVLSATYRQSAKASADALQRDPNNELLARGPHQRLTAEMVRDQALAASGLLEQKVGGESVKPFQPKGLWKATLGSGQWRESKGKDLYRRGLYVYWKRGVPYPSFMAFDASKRETCTVQRTQTTTPLQALVTLNDPVFVEAGRHLGMRLLDGKAADDQERLVHGFRLVASREPENKEVEVLSKLLADLRKHYAADEDAAKEVFAVDDKDGKGDKDKKSGGKKSKPSRNKNKKEHPLPERAAWAQIGCTLLNLEAAIRRG